MSGRRYCGSHDSTHLAGQVWNVLDRVKGIAVSEHDVNAKWDMLSRSIEYQEDVRSSIGVSIFAMYVTIMLLGIHSRSLRLTSMNGID